MFTTKEKVGMLVHELDNKFYCVLPFGFKDSLKLLIPSAKYDQLGKKEWSVNLCFKDKYIKWIECNYEDISKALLIKAKQDLKYGRMVIVHDSFCVKDDLKFMFGAVYGVYNEVKGWYVLPENHEGATKYRDNVIKDNRNNRLIPVKTDSKQVLLKKLGLAIDSFDIIKEENSFGYIARFRDTNPDVKALINLAASIIANNSKFKLSNPDYLTFDDVSTNVVKEICIKYDSLTAIETVFFSLLLNTFDVATSEIGTKKGEYNTKNDILSLICGHYMLEIYD